MKNGHFIGSVPYKPTWFENTLENILKERGFVLGKPYPVIDQELGIFEREAKIKIPKIYYYKDFDDSRLRSRYFSLFNEEKSISRKNIQDYFEEDFNNENITHESIGVLIKDDYYSMEIIKKKLNYIYVESEESIPHLLSILKSYIINHIKDKDLPSYYKKFESEFHSNLTLGRGFTHNMELILSHIPLLKKNVKFREIGLNNNQYLFYLFFSAILESALKI